MSAPHIIDLRLPQPYLLFLGDLKEAPYAKTAFGLRDWVPQQCVGEYALPEATVTTGLAQLTPSVAYDRHEAGREHVLGLPEFALPSLHEAIHLHLQLARRTNPHVRCAGVSLNTAKLPEKEARALLAKERARLSLPVGDPVRGGVEFEALVEACLTS